MSRPGRVRVARAALILVAALAVGIWAYPRLGRSRVLQRLQPERVRLEELRTEMSGAYSERRELLKRWMGTEEYSTKRFALPRELKTQDDFDLFEIGQNQIGEELAQQLSLPGATDQRSQRTRELHAIEEKIVRVRAQYHSMAARVIDELKDAGITDGVPPAFELDLKLTSGHAPATEPSTAPPDEGV